MYFDFVEFLQKKGEQFTDGIFPPNSSSLVNNMRGCHVFWKNSQWSNVDDVFAKTQFLKVFKPEMLFDIKGIFPHLAVVLSSLCEYPDRISRIFIQHQQNNEGSYLGRLFYKGCWKPILIDNFIPHDNQDLPICLKPPTHDQRFEIWPSLVAKL